MLVAVYDLPEVFSVPRWPTLHGHPVDSRRVWALPLGYLLQQAQMT